MFCGKFSIKLFGERFVNSTDFARSFFFRSVLFLSLFCVVFSFAVVDGLEEHEDSSPGFAAAK